jgi:hypothetical protein
MENAKKKTLNDVQNQAVQDAKKRSEKQNSTSRSSGPTAKKRLVFGGKKITSHPLRQTCLKYSQLLLPLVRNISDFYVK